jgi:hypothetical protein
VLCKATPTMHCTAIYYMKNLRTITIILAVSLVAIGCNNSNHSKVSETVTPAYSELEKAVWLIGMWQNNSSEGRATEQWRRENDSTFAGISYFMVANDTVNFEQIKLMQSNDSLFYIPVVKEQNNGLPVKFTMTFVDGNKLVFENPAHDFPQRISYTKISNDSLVAEISGTMNGEVNAQQFPMSRVK